MENDNKNLTPEPLMTPSIPKKWYQRKSIITVIILAAMAGIAIAAYFVFSPPKVSDQSPSPISSDNQIYNNSELGINFQYPSSWGEVQFSVNDGETGKQFLANFTKAPIHFGGITKDYSAGREGGYYDFTGYNKKGNQYYANLNNQSVFPSKCYEFIKEIEGVNSTGLLIKGLRDVPQLEGEYPCVEPDFQAWFNLNSPMFLGIVFTDLDSTDVPQEDFESFLKTLKITAIPSTSANHFLIAQDTDKGTALINYDTQHPDAARTITVKVPDPLRGSSNSDAYANNSVQYDLTAQKVYYLTSGANQEGGTPCFNADKTCDSRIYQSSLDGSNLKKLADLADYPSNWIVNPVTHSIYFTFNKTSSNGYEQIITRLDTVSGKISPFANYKLSTPSVALAKLVLSTDGKYIYQGAVYSTQQSGQPRTLKLHTINTTDKSLSTTDIYKTTESIEVSTTLTTDGQTMAFYAGPFLKWSLYNYNISGKALTQVPFTGQVSNSSLNWAGQRLLYNIDKSLRFYDIDSKKQDTIVPTNQADIEPYLIGSDSSGNFILIAQNKLSLYDFQTNSLVKLSLNFPTAGDISAIAGVTSY